MGPTRYVDHLGAAYGRREVRKALRTMPYYEGYRDPDERYGPLVDLRRDVYDGRRTMPGCGQPTSALLVHEAIAYREDRRKRATTRAIDSSAGVRGYFWSTIALIALIPGAMVAVYFVVGR